MSERNLLLTAPGTAGCTHCGGNTTNTGRWFRQGKQIVVRLGSDSVQQEGEQFLGGLWDRLTSMIRCKIGDRTARTPKSKRIRNRDLKSVDALVLHQMAFSRGSDPTRYDKVTAHYAIVPDGKILQLHPASAYLYASNGFNARSVAVEFAGNFPSTRGRCWKPETYGCHALTQAQIESGRCLVGHLIREIGLTHVLAHRQSSGTRGNDPGPDIWYHVGQWAIENLGLTDGGPDYKIGSGNPIPNEWRNWGRTGGQRELLVQPFRPEVATPLREEVAEIDPESPGHVQWLQRSLNEVLGMRLRTDGFLGATTRRALRRFQRQQGLEASGAITPRTEGSLLAAGATPHRHPSNA